jgi:hypothetical protein
MAWTLSELSKIETDTLRKSVIDTLLMESNVLELVPWETIGTLSTTVIKYQDLPSVGFRKINAGYSESTGTFAQKVENISLMGGMIDTDKALARAKNTVADARAIQQQMMVKAIAYKFNDRFINGDPSTDPEEFKGLSKRVDDIVSEGYTDQLIDCGGTYGAARDAGFLYDSANAYNFLNKLDQLMYSIKGHNPDFLLMNRKTLLALRAVLRKERLLDQSKDSFDRSIDMYSGARLVDIGTKADQLTEIITNTEDPQSLYTSDVSTSIYAVKFGIGEFLWGIQEYPMEVTDKGLLEAKPVYRTEIDFPLGLAHVDPRCLSRLLNVFPDGTVQS